MHYFTWNIGDYLKDTGGLSLIEHGAYSLLLQWAYANEKPLPLDEERLFRIASAVTKRDQAAVIDVLAQFFQREEDGFHHKRVILEIQKFYRRSEAGTKNIGKRYETPTKSLPTEQEADTKQADNHNARKTSNQKPETKNHLMEADASAALLVLDSAEEPPVDSPSGSVPKKKKGAAELAEPEFPEDVGEPYRIPLRMWWHHKREKKQGYTPSGWAILVRQQVQFPAAQVLASVEASMTRPWSGLFTHKFADAVLSGPGPQKKGGDGGLESPPCADWKEVAVMHAEEGVEWNLDGVNWHELSTAERRAVWEAWEHSQKGGNA
jgi:uncharacterized protein YdaU (DUF1376 family)